MGRANFKDGGVFAQNLQAGSFTITLDGGETGDGTANVTFAKPMKKTPKVQLTAAEHITTGVLSYKSATPLGFQAKVAGCNLTSDELTVSYLAMDDSYY